VPEVVSLAFAKPVYANQPEADYDPESGLSIGPELIEEESPLYEKAIGDTKLVIKRLMQERLDARTHAPPALLPLRAP